MTATPPAEETATDRETITMDDVYFLADLLDMPEHELVARILAR